MGVLDRFTPGQRTALMVGVPSVAGLVLIQKLRGGTAPAAEPDPAAAADPTGTITGTYMPSTDAIGTGELSSIVSGITDTLTGLTQAVSDLENKSANTVPPATTTTTRAYRYTTVAAPYGLGENLNQVAVRIRNVLGVTKTVHGQPLTASYLASVNNLAVSVTKALPRNTRIRY